MPPPRYLLGTTVVSDFFRHHPQVTAHFGSAAPGRLAISTVTLMEIEYGSGRQPAALTRFGGVWVALQSNLHVLPFEAPDAVQTARVRAHLARVGMPTGSQLAGTALARGLTPVTHDTAEFERMPDLALEDWWSA